MAITRFDPYRDVFGFYPSLQSLVQEYARQIGSSFKSRQIKMQLGQPRQQASPMVKVASSV